MYPDVYLANTYVQDRRHEVARVRMEEASAPLRQQRHHHWWARLRHHTPAPVLTPSPQPI